MVKEKKVKGYFYAFDPKIKRRVVHVVIDDYAISLVTGHKFKIKRRSLKMKSKEVDLNKVEKKIIKDFKGAFYGLRDFSDFEPEEDFYKIINNDEDLKKEVDEMRDYCDASEYAVLVGILYGLRLCKKYYEKEPIKVDFTKYIRGRENER